MMKKLLYSFAVLFILFAACEVKSQSLEGNYLVGAEKVEIRMDDYAYYVYREGGDIKNSLKYEESTPENDQIWVERKNGKKYGTFVFVSNYSTGVFTNYGYGKESNVKKTD